MFELVDPPREKEDQACQYMDRPLGDDHSLTVWRLEV